MKKFVRVVCVGLLLAGLGTLAYGDNATSAMQRLLEAFRTMVELEPTREGPLHDLVRGASVIKHTPNPAVQFVVPLDLEEFPVPGYLAVDIQNWSVHPEDATPPATHFANGHQQRNTGHTHVWIFDLDTGALVRFTGADGLLYNPDSGRYESALFTLAPGTYKAFVQLQNHDHTPAVQATAPLFPGIDSVIFVVPEPE